MRHTHDLPRFDNETRHNWGFQDGRADIEAGRARRNVSDLFDPEYARGYDKAWYQQDRIRREQQVIEMQAAVLRGTFQTEGR